MLTVTAVYRYLDPRSLHKNEGVHPGAQRDIVASSLEVSESTPVIRVKGPPFAPVEYQRILNARTIAGPLRERRRNSMRPRSKRSSAEDTVSSARCKSKGLCILECLSEWIVRYLWTVGEKSRNTRCQRRVQPFLLSA